MTLKLVETSAAKSPPSVPYVDDLCYFAVIDVSLILCSVNNLCVAGMRGGRDARDRRGNGISSSL